MIAAHPDTPSLDELVAQMAVSGQGTAPKDEWVIPSRHASTFLSEAAATLQARAAMRDAQGAGERSMQKTVDIFNAWTGNKLSVDDGWRFMIALKQAREIQGFYHDDDYVDLAAYCGLLGEQESSNKSRIKP